MNFTPVILTYISTWGKKHSLLVEVKLEFEDGHLRLVFSFLDEQLAKVWNKVYGAEFLRECNMTLYDLVKQTLEEAERYFKED